MAEFVLTNAKVLVNELDWTSDLNSVAAEYGADAQECTTFGNNTHQFIGGLKTNRISVEGFYDAANSEPQAFADVGVAGGIISLSPQSAGAQGQVAYFGQFMQASMQTGGAVGDVMPMSVSAEAQGPLVRGVVLANVAAATSSSQTTGIQQGAATATQTIYAALHVTSGTGTLDAVIESDDNSGFTSATSRITFTQATAATSEFKTLAGAVTDDYWRVNYTIAGGSPDFDFVVVLGIKNTN